MSKALAANQLDLPLAVTLAAAPAAPAAGIKFFTMDIAGRSMAAVRDAVGAPAPLQSSLAFKRVSQWVPNGGTTVTAIGTPNGVTGTNTARAPGSTNLFTATKRVGYASAAGAGSLSASFSTGTVNQFWRGNAAGLGGFFGLWRFGNSDAVLVPSANAFVGLRALTPTLDVAPSTLVNLLGVGVDATVDTVLQLYSSGAVAQPKVSLGANFPMNTINVDLYELVMFAPPNGAFVNWLVTRLNTGHTATGQVSVAANLPASTQFLQPQFYRSNGAVATAVAFDMAGMYLETDN